MRTSFLRVCDLALVTFWSKKCNSHCPWAYSTGLAQSGRYWFSRSLYNWWCHCVSNCSSLSHLRILNSNPCKRVLYKCPDWLYCVVLMAYHWLLPSYKLPASLATVYHVSTHARPSYALLGHVVSCSYFLFYWFRPLNPLPKLCRKV